MEESRRWFNAHTDCWELTYEGGTLEELLSFYDSLRAQDFRVFPPLRRTLETQYINYLKVEVVDPEDRNLQLILKLLK